MEDPSEVAIAEVCEFANLDPTDDRNLVIAALKVGCSRGALCRYFLVSCHPVILPSQLPRWDFSFAEDARGRSKSMDPNKDTRKANRALFFPSRPSLGVSKMLFLLSTTTHQSYGILETLRGCPYLLLLYTTLTGHLCTPF